MIIRGIEFPFSTLNADDVDRMLATQKRQQIRAKEEGGKYGTDPGRYPDWLRFQCRIFMDYLDEVLGEGASKQLGLTGRDFNECLAVSQEFADAMAAEKAAVKGSLRPDATPPAQNRAQRRAGKKARQRTQTAGQIGSKPPVVYPQPPAVQMVERVDKAARRKALLAELAALEND